MTKNKRSAIVAGATGLVGGHLLRLLLNSQHYDEVVAVARKPLTVDDPKLRQIVGDLGDVEDAVARAHVQTVDAYCALGTTIKIAGSQAEFRKVDYDYVIKFARAAQAAGATRFMIVSAIGAAPQSKIFYSRIKGETEQALGQMGFDALHIFQPGLLLGERSDTRRSESMMMKLMPILNPLLIRRAAIYKAIRGDVVARAMVAATGTPDEGRKVHTYDNMIALARGHVL